MNISLRLAGASGLLLLAFEIAPGALPGAPATWRERGPIASAHAYKVEKVCEEKQTKKGVEKKCKSVLIQESEGEKKKAVPASDKKDEKKKDAPASDKKDEKKKDAPAKH